MLSVFLFVIPASALLSAVYLPSSHGRAYQQAGVLALLLIAPGVAPVTELPENITVEISPLTWPDRISVSALPAKAPAQPAHEIHQRPAQHGQARSHNKQSQPGAVLPADEPQQRHAHPHQPVSAGPVIVF